MRTILPIYKILIVEFSLLLVLTCLLGCSVYHVQMWRDSNSESSLLNKLYTITAVIMQVQSVLFCAKVFENILGPHRSSFVKNTLLFSRVFNFFHIISLTILNVYRQYKRTEYLDISVDPRIHRIILSTEFLIRFLGTRGHLGTASLVSPLVRAKNLNHIWSLINHPRLMQDPSYELLP